MRRRASRVLILLISAFPVAAADAPALEKLHGYAGRDAASAETGRRGRASRAPRAYGGATVTVYDRGTTRAATIFASRDALPRSNPFAADDTGYWLFYAARGCYDVQLSGGEVPAPRVQTVCTTGPLTAASVVDVTDYGALGGAREVGDAVASAGSTSLTSTAAAFTPADVGKEVWIENAGPVLRYSEGGIDTHVSTDDLITTIEAFVDPTTVRLAARAARSVSAARAMIYANDTDAFAAAGDALEGADRRRCAATYRIPPGTYVIGKQDFQRGEKVWLPRPNVDIRGCSNPVTIEARNVRLILSPAMRFGGFDYQTGLPSPANMADPVEAAEAGVVMYLRENRSISVIGPLEIDGNNDDLIVGGQWGTDRHRRQLDGTALEPFNNVHFYAENLYLHHNALDGIRLIHPNANAGAPPRWSPRARLASPRRGPAGLLIAPTHANVTGLVYVSEAARGETGAVEPVWPTAAGETVSDGTIVWTATDPAAAASYSHTFVNVRTEYNSRQGMTWVGGNGLYVLDSSFDLSGRGDAWGGTSPRAGIDLEPNTMRARNGIFVGTGARGNKGAGVIAENHFRAYDVAFVGGVIWGNADAEAAYIRCPRFIFKRVTFHGLVVNTLESTNAADRTIWDSCHFEDKPDPQYGEHIPDASSGLLSTGYNTRGWGPRIVNCTFVSNRHRVWRIQLVGDPSAYKAHIRNTDVIIRGSSYQGGAPVMTADAVLENVRFIEEGAGGSAGGQQYVVSSGVVIGPGVSVTRRDGGTPNIKWNGLTGELPATAAHSAARAAAAER